MTAAFRIFLVLSVFFLCAAPLYVMHSAESAPHSTAAETALAVDKEKNIVRVMIAGNEVGRFDKDGLHVEGDITYSGSITDTGPSKPHEVTHAP